MKNDAHFWSDKGPDKPLLCLHFRARTSLTRKALAQERARLEETGLVVSGVGFILHGTASTNPNGHHSATA